MHRHNSYFLFNMIPATKLLSHGERNKRNTEKENCHYVVLVVFMTHLCRITTKIIIY
jgi:hypothetical protein